MIVQRFGTAWVTDIRYEGTCWSLHSGGSCHSADRTKTHQRSASIRVRPGDVLGGIDVVSERLRTRSKWSVSWVWR
ncbi:hypothetical protein BDZ85DRAFT_141538 [Elsinoe ampelina]|uniref:Uncharacterized protein n=1 Tax=Elsinoe ampelina TaxID=302913 RepID=A0A6A6FXH3_9PEZI|nr:hypothetical protein BDZ85DRAFT_141538 [Elsinoe ampelina]